VIPEAANVDEEEFGEERMAEILLENKDKSVQEIRDAVLDAVSRHCQGMEQADDITLVVAQAL